MSFAYDDTAPNCVVSFYPDSPNFYGLFTIEEVHPKSCLSYDDELNRYDYNDKTKSLSEDFKDTDGDGHLNYNEFYFEELGIMIYIAIFAVLFLICYINYKSCSPINTDWFRLIFIYITGTVALIIFFNVPTTNCGFHRNIIVGALVHNLIEAYILLYIWCGSEVLTLKKPNHLFYYILYVFIISLILLSIPVNYGAYIGLLHGWTIDYFLLFSFMYIRYRFKMNENESNYSHYAKTFYIAVISFICHIIGSLAIGGFLVQSAIVFIIGTVLLVPAFLFLTLFAIKYHKRMSFIGHRFKANEILLFNMQSKQEYENNNEISPDLQRCVTLNNYNTVSAENDHDNGLFRVGAYRYFKVEKKVFMTIIGVSFMFGLIFDTFVWMSPCFLPPVLMCKCY